MPYIRGMSDDTVPEVPEQVIDPNKNMFVPLVGEAYSVLRRAMHNSDQKLAVQTAKDVLDYAGQKKEPVREQRQFNFKDSQIQILVEVMKEALS